MLAARVLLPTPLVVASIILISFIQLAHAVQIQIAFHCDGRTLAPNTICHTLRLQGGRPGLTLAERVKKVGARAREESVVHGGKKADEDYLNSA